MNPEQNNFNQNNLNTQNNNVIPNNQPLPNNQNVSYSNVYQNQNIVQNPNINQQQINAQPQVAQNYQQPINQMNTTYQNNSFQTVNNQIPLQPEVNNNPSNNGKTNNKKILIIGIIIALVVIGIIFVIVLTVNSNKNNNNNNSLNNNVNEEDQNTQNQFSYYLVINDVEYKFPISYDEIIQRGGVSYCSTIGKETMEEFSNNIIRAGSYASPYNDGCGGMNIGDVTNISIIFNNSDGTEDAKIKDCNVIGMKFENGIPKGSVSLKGPNGTITAGESTREEVYEFFNGNYNYLDEKGQIVVSYDEQDLISWISFLLYP